MQHSVALKFAFRFRLQGKPPRRKVFEAKGLSQAGNTGVLVSPALNTRFDFSSLFYFADLFGIVLGIIFGSPLDNLFNFVWIATLILELLVDLFSNAFGIVSGFVLEANS